VASTAKVVLPSESLSGGTEVREKVVTAAEAVRFIRDGDSVVVEGFVGQCFAEELTLALEQRFLLTGTPKKPETWCSPSPRVTGRAAGWTGWLTTA
jgi:acyl CoA:acetate/3-ketoacid CoA transferase